MSSTAVDRLEVESQVEHEFARKRPFFHGRPEPSRLFVQSSDDLAGSVAQSCFSLRRVCPAHDGFYSFISTV